MQKKRKKREKSRLIFLLFLLIVCLSCVNDPGCHKTYEESWSFQGRQMVGFFSVRAVLSNQPGNFTDSILSADTMTLFIESKRVQGDSYRNDTLIVVKDSASVELSIYADAYNWQGCGIMPPTASNPTGLHVSPFLKLPPPFQPGIFLLKLHQTDGTITLDTIIVKQ